MRTTISISLIAAVLSFPCFALGQSFIDSRMELNYDYVYGSGGDSHADSGRLVRTSTAASDSDSLFFSGGTSGDGYTASVAVNTLTNYSVVGPLNSFLELFGMGSVSGEALATGTGLALMNASNPGSQMIARFDVASARDYAFVGDIEADPGEIGAGHIVALQQFDGLVWQNLYTTWQLPGLQGHFDQTLNLQPGQYRVFSQVGIKADSNEVWSTSYSYHVIPMGVPEPMTGLALLPALLVMRRRKRRA